MGEKPKAAVEGAEREPRELATQADLDRYAEVFGCDRDMVRLARRCPDCDDAILVCDNGWLDAKASPDGMCGVMKLGPLTMLCSPGGAGGSRHDLHEHQPDES